MKKQASIVDNHGLIVMAGADSNVTVIVLPFKKIVDLRLAAH